MNTAQTFVSAGRSPESRPPPAPPLRRGGALSSYEGSLAFVTEQIRVLRTGGIVKIVFPDLEVIGRAYVAHLDSLLSGHQSHEFAYDYALLLLLDQTAGDVSCGRLARVWATAIDPEIDYVRVRHGTAVAASTERKPQAQQSQPDLRQRISGRLARESLGAAAAEAAAIRVRRVHLTAAELLAYATLGRSGRDALRCDLFRASREIHRWM